MAKVTSAGHKLGQMVGNFFENFFSTKLVELAKELGDEYYCDMQGPRPVRGTKTKVRWKDRNGNFHDLDYVFEKGGTPNRVGEPAAFVELAWRRYTKHSKNKAGEIEAAILPLKETYENTCNFSGAILGGEFTQGALNQLESRDIKVLYIPYSKIVDAFLVKGINLDYPEDASNEEKQELLTAMEKLSPEDMQIIDNNFEKAIKNEYNEFIESLKTCVLREIEKILVFPLYGEQLVFNSLESAISSIKEYEMKPREDMNFVKFEIYIHFNNSDKIHGSFSGIEKAIAFLNLFKPLKSLEKEGEQSTLM